MLIVHIGNLPGFNLLQASIAESHGTNHNSHAFSRQLYLDSVSYLLQALPSDLSVHESLQIQRAVPHEMQQIGFPANATSLFHATSPPPSTTTTSPVQPQYNTATSSATKPRSMLHRGLSAGIVCLCLVFRIFLPWIRILFSTAYRYERNYRVSEKLFATTMSATDSVGRKAIEVASTALGSDLVVEGVAYCVDGFCGGLSEGFGEGLRAIEASQAR